MVSSPARDLNHHLDNGYLQPAAQILCGLAAHHAAADDGNRAVHLLLTGQNPLASGRYVHAVDAGRGAALCVRPQR